MQHRGPARFFGSNGNGVVAIIRAPKRGPSSWHGVTTTGAFLHFGGPRDERYFDPQAPSGESDIGRNANRGMLAKNQSSSEV